MSHAAIAPGKVAVITGAADGIGLAAAKYFAGQGMNVLMADINELGGPAEAVTASAGGDVRVETRQLDVSDRAQVEGLKNHAYDLFGQVDVLMNNAGTGGKTHAWDLYEEWQRIIGVNLWGIVHGVHAFAETMIAQNAPGLIINTGSKQGITNPPGNPAYNVSKAGVKTATEVLQHTLRNTEGCQVTAHLLVPGFTYTGLIRRHVSEKPAGAWDSEQVVDYMVEKLAQGSFYIICPDNEVSEAADAKRVLWGAGDIAYDRAPLSRWEGNYGDEFEAFQP
ncbi:MAG: SDR family NAD(P)-dependent oxidoreductase [Pseudomonadota bacterium]